MEQALQRLEHHHHAGGEGEQSLSRAAIADQGQGAEPQADRQL
jgi:hypothetical protein